MTKTGMFFRKLGAKITLLLHGDLPDGWQEITTGMVTGLNILKTAAGAILTIEDVFGKRIGEDAIKRLIATFNSDILAIEIAKGAEKAIEGVQGDQQRADAIFAYIGTRLNEMPEKWRGKHFLDLATTIVKTLLNVSTTVAGSIVLLKYGEVTIPSYTHNN